MLAPVNHILPLTTIERKRVLPVAGNVVAKLNQKISPTDVIAEATWAREHVLIDVARTLSISSNAADRLLRVKEGDKVSEGSEIAISKGIIPNTIRAPRSGRVVAAGGGQVLMETGETTVELKAGLPGTVVQIIPYRGALIRTVGALIQGTWGNGRIETGAMTNLTEKPDDILDASRLDVSLRGTIILAGLLRDADTLRAAAELPVRGLILSSIPPALLPAAQQMRFPIVAIDGFGQIPMNSVAYKLLTSSAKREVTINAEAFNRHTGARPEVIIPLPVSQEPPPPTDVDTLEVGQTVRLRRAPHAGTIGTLANFSSGLVTLPSGLRALAAEVKLENGEQILVPLVNLEIVG
jgi:biotin carboxyl carrier protein